MSRPATRNTINMEDARLLEHQSFKGDQHVMRLYAPKVSKQALPGSFIHIVCDPSLPMRRPMSIMRANPENEWIDILFKVHGRGTKLLTHRTIDEVVNILGPIGTPYKLDEYRKKPLLIGGGVGVPPTVFLAEHMKNTAKGISPFVILGSEVPFPFQVRPSQIMVSGLPDDIIASMPLLEDWKVASRLCSLQGYADCFDGYVTDLARHWLKNFVADQLTDVEIFSCGPTLMLKAVAQLANEFDIPCQVSLEEYMACAVGGCAGCAVEVITDSGPAMKRVCVDGPVFEASTVFPI